MKSKPQILEEPHSQSIHDGMDMIILHIPNLNVLTARSDGITSKYTLWQVSITMAIETVSFSIENGDFP